MKKEKNVFGFSFWYEGGKLHTGIIYQSAKGNLDLGRDKYDLYREAGNNIASWFEGTLKECNDYFGEGNW